MLLSGGLDSTTLLAELATRGVHVDALTFDYAQRHVAEIAAAADLARTYGVADHRTVRLELPLGPGHPLRSGGTAVPEYAGAVAPGHVETYVAMRNLILLGYAAAVAEVRGIERVWVGFNRDDAANYWDCARGRVDGLNAVLARSTGGLVRVEAPFLAMSKGEVLQRARALGVPVERTVSCYSPGVGAVPCRRCLACTLLLAGGSKEHSS